MILAEHELQSLVCVLVVSLDSLVHRHVVRLLRETFFELNETDYGIVHDADELGPDAFIDERDALCLDAADTVGFDVYLVGQRRRPEDSPRCPIVVELLHEQSPALRHHLLELFLRIHSVS